MRVAVKWEGGGCVAIAVVPRHMPVWDVLRVLCHVMQVHTDTSAVRSLHHNTVHLCIKGPPAMH